MKHGWLISLVSANCLVGCIIEDPAPPNPPQQYHYCDTHDCNETPGNPGDPNPSTGYCGDRDPIPFGVELPVPGFYQQCQQWCWAAAAAMVTGYYGNYLTECEFASALVYGDQTSCCYYGCGGCNYTATMPQLSALMVRAGIRHRTGGALSESTLQIELSNGRPVILELRGAFSGHAVVVNGFYGDSYGNSFYSVLDPWFGPSYATYWNLRNGYANGQAIWSGTMYRLSPRADGCNMSFDPSCGCEEAPEWDEFSN